jgi:hypothetical protein
VMLVAIRHRSAEEPAWVADLGLNGSAGSSGDTVPALDRLGSSDPSSGGPSNSGPSTTSGSIPTSPGAASSSSDSPPVIDATGEDFAHVWEQIEVLESWLLQHPTSPLASDIYETGTPPYDDLVKLLKELTDKGQTARVDGYRILGVTVDGRLSPDRVDLRYADTYRDRFTFDATGTVVGHTPSDGRARLWTLTLHRGEDGRWRVVATAFVTYGDVVTPASS